MHYRESWSDSKFADFIRGTELLSCGTSEEWDAWRVNAVSNHPIRYYLADSLDSLQNIIYWPCDIIYKIRCYFSNRFVSKTHQLTASSSHIKRGVWVEFGDRILPCLFDELVNFVEIELADKNYEFMDAHPSYSHKRCPESGINYLTWEMSLVYDKDSGMTRRNKLYGKPTPQAEAARGILELYTWYTQIYNNRKDPFENDTGRILVNNHTLSDAERKEIKLQYANINRLEKQYADEDEKMLIKLIKLRQSLWS